MCPIDSNRITQDRASLNKERNGMEKAAKISFIFFFFFFWEIHERKKIIVSTDVIPSCFKL